MSWQWVQLWWILRLRWWWRWQQTDELAVGAALMDFEVALVVAVAADELSVDATQVDWLAVW
jgi:hypothetical protein